MIVIISFKVLKDFANITLCGSILTYVYVCTSIDISVKARI